MEAVWRFRLMLFTALALIMFGDFFGYGSIRVVKSASGKGTTTFRKNPPKIEIDGETPLGELSSSTNSLDINERRKNAKAKLSEAIREACLPKMLCEMASRPEFARTDKERSLLQLIKSTSMSLAMNSPPTRWHFAAHMGELLRHTSDSLSGPIGCANLWPHCPFSSKKLMSLTYKVNLK